MPFTPAHTIAVLPFVGKKKLSGSALIAGSMSPDFEYFIRIDSSSEWGHDLLGLIVFDLPMTFAIVTIFHLLVKRNLIDNLPRFLQRRMSHLKEITFQNDVVKRPITFALCALLGALTHIIWDGFTHGYGYFVQALPWAYEGRTLFYRGANYPLWYVAQQVSTAVGLTTLIVYVFAMRPVHASMKPGFLYWVLLGGVVLIVVQVRYQFPHTIGLPMYVITSISGLLIGVVLLGMLPARKEIAT